MEIFRYNYKFITNNPSSETIDKMFQFGIRACKVQESIWYLAKSFITHEEAMFYCKECGLAVSSFKRIKVNSPET